MAWRGDVSADVADLFSEAEQREDREIEAWEVWGQKRLEAERRREDLRPPRPQTPERSAQRLACHHRLYQADPSYRARHLARSAAYQKQFTTGQSPGRRGAYSREEFLRLRVAGVSVAECARRFGVARNTLYQALRAMQKEAGE
jgi:hypothetical protein